MSDQAVAHPVTPAVATGLGRRVTAAIPRGGAALLTIGTVASGVLAYVFIVLAARTLGPAAYGPIAVLWAAVFLTSIVLFRPLEQVLSRGIAERLAQGQSAGEVWRSVARLMAVVVVVAAAITALFWGPVTDKLFDGRDALTAAFIVALAGYALSFLARGIVGGMRWFGGYGTVLLADGWVRVLFALPLLLFASPAVAAAAIAAAAIGGALAPLIAIRRGDPEVRARAAALREPSGTTFHTGHAVREALPVTAIASADQLLVSGGVLLVMLAGGPHAARDAGVVFAATMLVRAPVFLYQGFAAALLPVLTTSHARGEHADFRRAVMRAIGVLSAFAAVLVAGTLIAGPELMRGFFGKGFDANRVDLALLAAGVGLYLASSTLSQAAIARRLTGRAAVAWVISGITFVAIELMLDGPPLHRIAIAFLVATGVNALLFATVVSRGRAPREDDVRLGDLDPGAPGEPVRQQAA